MQAAANAIAERISSISESSTMKVAADAAKLRANGVDVVDFGAGEPDFPTPDNIKQAAIRALEQNFTKYTAASGILELKQAVCERHAQDFGTAYKPSECLITVGGKHLIFNVTQAVINPGDEVVIPVPYWVTYKDVVNFAGGKCVFVDTDESRGFTLTADMVERHLSSRTRMIIINSPSNPSGAVIDRDEFEKILRLAAARGIYLMTDECYCKFLYDSEPFSIASLPGAKETVLVAGSLSKTYAMTGWRIGFGLAPAPLIEAMGKLQSHSTSNPTSIAQKAGGGSAARTAGFGSGDAGRIPQAPRFRGAAAAGDSRREMRRAARGVLRLSEFGRGHRQERYSRHAAAFRAIAGRGACGRGSRRGLRHGPARAHLLRHVDERTGTRAGAHPRVCRPEFIIVSQAIRLTPSLREKVWGKTRLAPWFPDSEKPIGEAWFLADRELPLLVKLLFTSERLSVQVHPDDGEDGARGKTEMWHILDAEAGAVIALGFREPITRERLYESAKTGEIERLLNWMPVHAGETYFVPAHTVHAIGGGIVLCEIQQNSDVTYRLWDYGRPRELHLEKAAAIADLGMHPGASREAVRSRFFVTEPIGGTRVTPDAHQCQIWICLAGNATIGGEPVHAGEAWLLPDAGEQPVIEAQEARFLRTYVPEALSCKQ